jgi:LysM repeat protein
MEIGEGRVTPTSRHQQGPSSLDRMIGPMADQILIQEESKLSPAIPRNEETKEQNEIYVVQQGDTLLRIAMKLNISLARLKKYNHLFGKNDVIIGQVSSPSVSVSFC